MKRILAIVLITVLASFAAEKNNALGLWLQGGNAGEHWGLDWKHRLDKTVATDLYFRLYSSNDETSLGAYVGYYFHHYDIIPLDASAGRMPLYWGPYGGFGYWNNDWNGAHDETGLAIRFGVVGGWAWELPTAIPLEFWLELNPVAEFQHYSWDDHNYDRDNDTRWQIPDLYIRLGMRAYFF